MSCVAECFNSVRNMRPETSIEEKCQCVWIKECAPLLLLYQLLLDDAVTSVIQGQSTKSKISCIFVLERSLDIDHHG